MAFKEELYDFRHGRDPGTGSPWSNASDSSLNESLPNTNYGTNTYLRTDYTSSAEWHTWIAWDIYGIIPTNAIVVDARIDLYAQYFAASSNGVVGIYRCLKKPTESQVTWNDVWSSPSTLSWNIAGAQGESTTENDNDDNTKADRRIFSGTGQSKLLYAFSYIHGSTNKWITLVPSGTQRLIDLVQGWVDGSIESARGIILDARDNLSPASPLAIMFNRSSDWSSSVYRPRLRVTTTVPSGRPANEFNRFNAPRHGGF